MLLPLHAHVILFVFLSFRSNEGGHHISQAQMQDSILNSGFRQNRHSSSSGMLESECEDAMGSDVRDLTEVRSRFTLIYSS